MSPVLVGLYSDTPGCGKTFAAEQLVEHHRFARVRFADPIKKMVGVFLERSGVDVDLIPRILDGDMKEDHLLRVYGLTARRLMQTLGTEWGRSCVSPEVWLDLCRRQVMKLLDARHSVVVDDVRFANEAEMIRRQGGLLIKIESDRSVASNGHVSDGGISGIKFDAVIQNNVAEPDRMVADLRYIIAGVVP